MILLDTDVFLLDKRHTTDHRFAVNRRALDRLRQDAHEVGVTTQVLLEVVGSLSYQTSAADVPMLPDALRVQYGLRVLPDPAVTPEYACCSFDDLLTQMTAKMSLGDAVLAVQIRLFAPAATALLTWNAKHFRGKVVVPVLTPDEWLNLYPQGPTP
jgi:hypothetical protein